MCKLLFLWVTWSKWKDAPRVPRAWPLCPSARGQPPSTCPPPQLPTLDYLEVKLRQCII